MTRYAVHWAVYAPGEAPFAIIGEARKSPWYDALHSFPPPITPTKT